VALISEVDVRKLFAGAGYPSLYPFCIQRLGFSEDEASKRIAAARAARDFPVIFDLLADGQLHLTAVRLLRPYLTPGNVNGLLRASIRKTAEEIRQLLADRFPCPDVPTRVVAPIAAPRSPGSEARSLLAPVDQSELPALEPVRILSLGASSAVQVAGATDPVATSRPAEPMAAIASRESAAPPQPAPIARGRVAPLGAARYGIQVQLKQSTYGKMRRLQELLGSRVRSDDLDAVLEHAFDAAIAQLEKKKFAATDKPRVGKPSTNPRNIPARVKRAVRRRDGGQCTFVGDGGHRCEAHRDLEFDHALPVARGGEATVANIRLRCRTHNQLEAERAYGQEFMNGKRFAAAETAGRAILAPWRDQSSRPTFARRLPATPAPRNPSTWNAPRP